MSVRSTSGSSANLQTLMGLADDPTTFEKFRVRYPAYINCTNTNRAVEHCYQSDETDVRYEQNIRQSDTICSDSVHDRCMSY